MSVFAGVTFDFEAIKENYDRGRVVYIDKITVSSQNRTANAANENRKVYVSGVTVSSKNRTVHVMQEDRKVYVERFSTSAERRARAKIGDFNVI